MIERVGVVAVDVMAAVAVVAVAVAAAAAAAAAVAVAAVALIDCTAGRCGCCSEGDLSRTGGSADDHGHNRRPVRLWFEFEIASAGSLAQYPSAGCSVEVVRV